MLKIIWFSFLLVFATASTSSKPPSDILVYNTLADGEVELRVRFRGISAKETSVGRGNGLKYRQLTDGKHLIQLIYDEDDHLQDCEFVHNKHSVHAFLKDFRKDLHVLSSANATFTAADPGSLPAGVRQWLQYRKLKKECAERHSEIQESLHVDDGKNGRFRRDMSDIFRVPGTKWCGKGYSAGKYTHLGGFSRTDRCCRKHDTACPFWIGGFETKYGLFNWRVNTIMHCSCDERFRSCLKMVDTSDANLVGKLFFNVVQTKCFTLKPKKRCTKRSWWGKCVKRKYVKQAVLRDNIPY